MTHSALSPTALAVFAPALLFLLAGCQAHHSPAGFFPDSTEAPGWSKSPEVRTFSPDQLPDYIDGDAEKYLKAGVRSTSTADYKFENQGEATVGIYTMSSAAGAKSIFESEPAMKAQTPSIGDAARLYPQSLIFRKGRHLVRIVAFQDSPEVTEAMYNLGVAIEKNSLIKEDLAMKNGTPKSRREFLRNCAIGALAAGASSYTFTDGRIVNYPGAAAAKSKVVVARDAALYGGSSIPDSSRVQKLLDEAMQYFFQTSDPVSPWKKIVGPREVVGLKVNTIAGPGLSTHPVLIAAICERLQQAGVKASNIAVWDRSNDELDRAGYTLSNDTNRARFVGTDSKEIGYDQTIFTAVSTRTRLSNLLTRTCDCMINVPILKHHESSGVTLALKNMYGVNNNPRDFHANNCCPGVVDLNTLTPIRSKFRFIVGDAMTACFAGAPGYKPQYAWKYNGIMVASDPVAIDHTAWQIIEKKRAGVGLPTLLQAGAAPKYIAIAADLQHQLGTNDPSRIDLVEV